MSFDSETSLLGRLPSPAESCAHSFLPSTIGRWKLQETPVLFLAALLALAPVGYSQKPAEVPTPGRVRLVVGLTQSPPFSMRAEDGSWTGISVDLWQWIAADLGVDTDFRETTVTGLFDDLAPGRPLDVSIGALTITAEREDRLDFSQPFFLSGLCVAVKTAPGPGRLWSWLARVLVWDFWRIVAALFVSLVRGAPDRTCPSRSQRRPSLALYRTKRTVRREDHSLTAKLSNGTLRYRAARWEPLA
jgi:Bacterial extracellular solute-binding proteins, family 3